MFKGNRYTIIIHGLESVCALPLPLTREESRKSPSVHILPRQGNLTTVYDPYCHETTNNPSKKPTKPKIHARRFDVVSSACDDNQTIDGSYLRCDEVSINGLLSTRITSTTTPLCPDDKLAFQLGHLFLRLVFSFYDTQRPVQTILSATSALVIFRHRLPVLCKMYRLSIRLDRTCFSFVSP